MGTALLQNIDEFKPPPTKQGADGGPSNSGPVQLRSKTELRQEINSTPGSPVALFCM